jgi:hypothetical protein
VDGFFKAVLRQKEADRLLQFFTTIAIAASIKTPDINKAATTN